jgi:predicted HicB family RNase H-like nuclease
MGDRENDDEHIHVRCTEEFKRRINLAAAATDRNLSEYVREELEEAADEDLEGVVVDDVRVDA